MSAMSNAKVLLSVERCSMVLWSSPLGAAVSVLSSSILPLGEVAERVGGECGDS